MTIAVDADDVKGVLKGTQNAKLGKPFRILVAMLVVDRVYLIYLRQAVFAANNNIELFCQYLNTSLIVLAETVYYL